MAEAGDTMRAHQTKLVPPGEHNVWRRGNGIRGPKLMPLQLAGHVVSSQSPATPSDSHAGCAGCCLRPGEHVCRHARMHRAHTTPRLSSRLEAGKQVLGMLTASKRLRHAPRDSSWDKLMLFDQRKSGMHVAS